MKVHFFSLFILSGNFEGALSSERGSCLLRLLWCWCWDVNGAQLYVEADLLSLVPGLSVKERCFIRLPQTETHLKTFIIIQEIGVYFYLALSHRWNLHMYFVLILPKKRSFEQEDTKVTFAPAAAGGGWSLDSCPAMLLSPVTPLHMGGLWERLAVVIFTACVWAGVFHCVLFHNLNRPCRQTALNLWPGLEMLPFTN